MALTAAFLAAFFFPGQAASAATPPAPGGARAERPLYVIGPEDVLEISVWKNADLSKVVTVRPDGKISLPLVGDLMAAGRTPEELRDALAARLSEYQKTVVVSVIVQDVKSYRIYMVGEVRSPGVFNLKSKTTVLQAIAMAGGFTQFASKNKILVIREKPGAAGGSEKIRVRYDDIVDRKVFSDNNLTLVPGDTIIVP